MKRAIIRIRRDRNGLDALGKEFIRTWKSGRSNGDILQFESPAALFRVLTPKRWELVEKLQALGPVSLRGLARSLERDVKRVHEDVAELMERGMIERTEGGKIHGFMLTLMSSDTLASGKGVFWLNDALADAPLRPFF